MILPSEQPVGLTPHALHLSSLEGSFGLSVSDNLTCLENSKPSDVKSQAFACLGKTNQNAQMLIQQIRRARLRQWFSERSIPAKEKSYISQLLKEGNPFGERAARRLESTYGMGDMYLDRPDEEQPEEYPTPTTPATQGQAGAPGLTSQPGHPDPLLQVRRLIELFHGADERGREDMLRMAEMLSRADGHHAGRNER